MFGFWGDFKPRTRTLPKCSKVCFSRSVAKSSAFGNLDPIAVGELDTKVAQPSVARALGVSAATRTTLGRCYSGQADWILGNLACSEDTPIASCTGLYWALGVEWVGSWQLAVYTMDMTCCFFTFARTTLVWNGRMFSVPLHSSHWAVSGGQWPGPNLFKSKTISGGCPARDESGYHGR